MGEKFSEDTTFKPAKEGLLQSGNTNESLLLLLLLSLSSLLSLHKTHTLSRTAWQSSDLRNRAGRKLSVTRNPGDVNTKSRQKKKNTSTCWWASACSSQTTAPEILAAFSRARCNRPVSPPIPDEGARWRHWKSCTSMAGDADKKKSIHLDVHHHHIHPIAIIRWLTFDSLAETRREATSFDSDIVKRTTIEDDYEVQKRDVRSGTDAHSAIDQLSCTLWHLTNKKRHNERRRLLTGSQDP